MATDLVTTPTASTMLCRLAESLCPSKLTSLSMWRRGSSSSRRSSHKEESIFTTGKLSPAMVLVHALMALDKPVVIGVQGNATGIGTTLLLHADLVVAADDARFQTAFINLGLVPEAGSSLLLPALIGRQNANRLLLAGDTLTAEEAERCSLVAYRVTPDELEPTAKALAQRLAEKSPPAMAMTKQLLRHSHEAIKTQIEKESVLFAERMFSEDTRERFSKFLKGS